jgi:hypothetical protein
MKKNQTSKISLHGPFKTISCKHRLTIISHMRHDNCHQSDLNSTFGRFDSIFIRLKGTGSVSISWTSQILVSPGR